MGVMRGKRVLVVEDEMLVALVYEDMLLDAGAEMVGPAGTLEAGLRLAREEGLDAAILDVNLGQAESFPIADELGHRGVPYLFATGCGQTVAGRAGTVPIVDKPFSAYEIVGTLEGLVSAASRG